LAVDYSGFVIPDIYRLHIWKALGVSDSSAKTEISYDFLIRITHKILDLKAEVEKAFETRGSSKPDRLNCNTQAARLINEVYRAWCNNRLKKILKTDGKPFNKINGVTTDVSTAI